MAYFFRNYHRYGDVLLASIRAEEQSMERRSWPRAHSLAGPGRPCHTTPTAPSCNRAATLRHDCDCFRREGRTYPARRFMLRRVNIRHPDDPDIRVHIADYLH